MVALFRYDLISIRGVRCEICYEQFKKKVIRRMTSQSQVEEFWQMRLILL